MKRPRADGKMTPGGKAATAGSSPVPYTWSTQSAFPRAQNERAQTLPVTFPFKCAKNVYLDVSVLRELLSRKVKT